MTSRKRQYMFPMYPWNPHKEDVGQRPLYMLSTSKKKIFHQMGLDIYIYTQFHSLAEKGILRVNFAAMSQPFLFGIRNCRQVYIYIYISIYACNAM